MFTKLYFQIYNFLADRKGVTAIEYAILAVAVAVIVLAVFANSDTGLKAALTDAFDKVTSLISGA